MTRYPRQVDREYLSCRAGGLNKIQVIDGGTLDLHQDLVACDRRRRYIREHQLPAVFQHSDRVHMISPRVRRASCSRRRSPLRCSRARESSKAPLSRELVEKEIDGGNPALLGDDEI